MRRSAASSSRPFPVMVAAAIISITGCSDHMPVEEARQAVVVDVGGAVLTGADLEEMMMAAPQAPNDEIAAAVISTFIDAGALRAALADGVDLTDSVVTARSIEPDAIRGMLNEALISRALQLPPPSDALVDSVFRVGNARVFQQILFAPRPDDDSATVMGFLDRARTVLGELQTGGDFSAAVRRHSNDSLSLPRNGFLPAATRADLPEGAFASAVWRLQPGEFTSVIISPVGFHIVRRATLEESRDAIRAWLVPRIARTTDSLWLDSLSLARGVKVADGVAPRLRELAAEPLKGGGDSPYASWEGGELSAAAVRMWLSVIPAGERARLTVAPDSAVSLLLREFSQRELAYATLVGGPRIAPRAWEQLAPQFRDAVTSIREAYGQRLTSGTPTETVNQFMREITRGTIPYRPLPGAMSMVIRDRTEVSVNHKAVSALILAAATEWSRRHSDTLATNP